MQHLFGRAHHCPTPWCQPTRFLISAWSPALYSSCKGVSFVESPVKESYRSGRNVLTASTDDSPMSTNTVLASFLESWSAAGQHTEIEHNPVAQLETRWYFHIFNVRCARRQLDDTLLRPVPVVKVRSTARGAFGHGCTKTLPEAYLRPTCLLMFCKALKCKQSTHLHL